MTSKEGNAIDRPPLLKGIEYTYWKLRMRAFIKSVDLSAWRAVEDGWSSPTVEDKNGKKSLKPVSEWSQDEEGMALGNSKAINALFKAVDEEQLKLISACKSAKEAWEVLQTVHEGTSPIKSSKLQMMATHVEEIQMADVKDSKEIVDTDHGDDFDLLTKKFRHLLGRIESKGRKLRSKISSPVEAPTRSPVNQEEEQTSKRFQGLESKGLGHVQAECANILKKEKGMSLTSMRSDEESKGSKIDSKYVPSEQHSDCNVYEDAGSHVATLLSKSVCHNSNVVSNVITSFTTLSDGTKSGVGLTSDSEDEEAPDYHGNLPVSESKEDRDTDGCAYNNDIRSTFHFLHDRWLKACSLNKALREENAMLRKEKEAAESKYIREKSSMGRIVGNHIRLMHIGSQNSSSPTTKKPPFLKKDVINPELKKAPGTNRKEKVGLHKNYASKRSQTASKLKRQWIRKDELCFMAAHTISRALSNLWHQNFNDKDFVTTFVATIREGPDIPTVPPDLRATLKLHRHY